MIVGITGYAQHGKDTAAEFLVNNFGFVRIGFADALKELALAVNPIVVTNDGIAEYEVRLQDLVTDTGKLPCDEAFGWEEAKQVSEVRRFLQVLGTSARGILGDDVWVRALDKAARHRTNVVIPDVRFPNEAEYVTRHRQGLLWRVTRTNPDGTPYDNGVGTAHESERYVPTLGAMREIVASSVEELQGKVLRFAEYDVWGRLVP